MTKREKVRNIIFNYGGCNNLSMDIIVDKILALDQDDKPKQEAMYSCCYTSAKQGEPCPIHNRQKECEHEWVELPHLICKKCRDTKHTTIEDCIPTPPVPSNKIEKLEVPNCNHKISYEDMGLTELLEELKFVSNKLIESAVNRLNGEK